MILSVYVKNIMLNTILKIDMFSFVSVYSILKIDRRLVLEVTQLISLTIYREAALYSGVSPLSSTTVVITVSAEADVGRERAREVRRRSMY